MASQQLKAAYDKCLELNVATPSLVLSYCRHLSESDEEAFKVLERAIDMFTWPHVYELWIYYLKRAVDSLKGRKLERVRELFQKCLRSLPSLAGKSKNE